MSTDKIDSGKRGDAELSEKDLNKATGRIAVMRVSDKPVVNG